MPNYVINKQKTDGRYNEVHRTDCSRVPSIYNRESIGWHANEIDAVHYAQNIGYPAATTAVREHTRAKQHRGTENNFLSLSSIRRLAELPSSRYNIVQ